MIKNTVFYNDLMGTEVNSNDELLTFLSTEDIANKFLNSLVNRISKTIYHQKVFENPLLPLKKGMIPWGLWIQHIGVFAVKGKQYQFDSSGTVQFAKHKPNVRANYYAVNAKRYYPVTINRAEITNAVVNEGGLERLEAMIKESMYAGATIDDFLIAKYLLYWAIYDKHEKSDNTQGIIAPSPTDEDTSNAFISKMLETANNFSIPSAEYNDSHEFTQTSKSDSVIIYTSEVDAVSSVYTLAKAFNENYVQQASKKIIIGKSFVLTDSEKARLSEILDGYRQPNSITDTVVSKVNAVICDKEFFQIYDREPITKMNEDILELSVNFLFHVWNTFATCDFVNFAYFIDEE